MALISIPGYSIVVSVGTSDLFPSYTEAPALTSYVSGGTFNNTYYIATTGDDTTGDGSIGNPWQSFAGATDGGAGTAIAAGDLLYCRGGTYPLSAVGSLWLESENQIENSGTPSDYIVITAYPDETPVWIGGVTYISFSTKANYIVLDSLTIGVDGNMTFKNSNYIVMQNCTFVDGSGEDGWDDQVYGHQVIMQNSNNITIRNNSFGSTVDQHAIKNYESNSSSDSIIIIYNTFTNTSCANGAINHKGPADDWEIAYNRFEGINEVIDFGIEYGWGPQYLYDNHEIHHNAFDECSSYICRREDNANRISNLSMHNNIVLNGSSLSFLDMAQNDFSYTGSETMGEFYNNAFYTLTDVIDNTNNNDSTNYPTYFNYNAYQSTTLRDSVENLNSVTASSWQGSALVQASHGITRTGVSGDYFYTIEPDNGLVGAGRYADNIGGFTWS